MNMRASALRRQKGLSLSGLIVLLVIAGAIGLLAMRVVPTVTEYFSIKKAIAEVKAGGGSIPEMRASFDRRADAGYIDSISGKDLDIVQNDGDTEISFSYQKVIPLAGPVSLLIDYQGSTKPNGGK